jgi:hypothetical protein
VKQVYIHVVSSLMMRNIKVRTALLNLLILVECKETTNIILKPELRLRVFENRVLRRIFVPKKYEVIREWRKLRNEELNDLYCLPIIIQMIQSRRMRWERHVARVGERRGVYSVLVVKRVGNRPLGRHKRGWKDNIKVDLQEV